MSENNGWPERPGVPLNPERDGWHWLRRRANGAASVWWWIDGDGDGDFSWYEDDDGDPDFMARQFDYEGPCITPAEHAAALAAEYKRGQEAMRERAADIATKLSAEYANETPKPGREQECAGMEAGAAYAAKAIRAAAGETQP